MQLDVMDLFRCWGYLQADLDPLGRLEHVAHAELDAIPADEAETSRKIYCGSIGVEFMHIADFGIRHWIAAHMESEWTDVDSDRVLRDLATAEIFEQFMHARYVGSKRYSLEGAAALIPLLHASLDAAAGRGVETVLVAMSHRGRLNVMANCVGVPAAHIFTGFQDVDPRSFLGGGDVKYHLGATGTYTTPSGKTVHMHLVSNPSHLEAVNPVLMGRVRARQERLGEKGRTAVLGINVHGEAAFAGQGIAAETLNMAGLPGCSVGGTVHIVVNNLIGFTTEPQSLHSSRFASDVARRLPVPVFHVNGEDPVAVVHAGRLASEYRFAFASDVVVDLICFRRHGHSEVDDPTTTQPLLYRKIASWPRLWEKYARAIGKSNEELATMREGIEACLQEALTAARAAQKSPVLRRLPAYWQPFRGGAHDPAVEVQTSVDAARLEDVTLRLAKLPDGFTPHPKIKKGLEARLEQGLGRQRIDWGTAEALAFGSLLWDGVHVRVSGQDTCRGTFNHRHAVLFDYETGDPHVPLAHLHSKQGRFGIYNSSLSEAAELGFVYGFSRDYPEALVCWEAQFGDFANGAQVIIDQFVSSAEDKWALLSGIVLLLPHGYEGQGPEHSSARLERFLQLAAEDNIQVCQPSTAAQYFHLLRRQAIRAWRKPLILLTPKSVLRADSVASKRDDLTHGGFRCVIPDNGYTDARRLIVCSGKIVHELRVAREEQQIDDVAIVTLEQLYPVPADDLDNVIQLYSRAREIVWVQEEPANMGALFFIRPYIERCARGRAVTTVKRCASASPATGSARAHALEQGALINVAFGPRTP